MNYYEDDFYYEDDYCETDWGAGDWADYLGCDLDDLDYAMEVWADSICERD